MSRRRGNGDGSVQLRKDGRWCGIASLPGSGKRRTVYGRTRQEATDKLRALQEAVDKALPVPSETLTVSAYLRGWLAGIRVEASTYRGYESLIRVHAIPPLGHLRLVRLEPRHLEALYADRQRAGMGGTTLQHLHAVLHRALNVATRQGIVARNVADLIDSPRMDRPEMKWLNDEESRRFHRAAEADPIHGALFILAITSGMRAGELGGLRWRDVDLDRGYLSVAQTLKKPGRVPLFGNPKTRKSRRRIDLADRAIAALRGQRTRQAEVRLRARNWHDLDLVFTNRNGGPIDLHNVSQREYRHLLERAELPRIRFHDLRHTAATLLLVKGVHPKVVSEMLGHSTIALTLDTYSHVLEGMQQEAVTALNEVFA